MFTSRYYHTLEAKSRLAIPSAYRGELKSGGVITIGLDGCLFLFPNSYWQELTNKLASLPLTNLAARQFTRLLVQSAVDLNLDSQGRTLIPDFLKQNASLKKQVVIAGALERIEIWDRGRYHQHLDLISEANPNWEESLKDLGL